MPVKFSVDKSSLERTVVPQGMYTLEVMSLSPKAASKAESGFNLNGRYQIVNRIGEDDPELAAKKIQVFDSLNTRFGIGIQDFAHACGFTLDTEGNIPGEFDGPDDKLVYSGPLLGVRFEAEIAIRDYQGTPQNSIKSYVCKVQDCAANNPKIKHSKNLLGKG